MISGTNPLRLDTAIWMKVLPVEPEVFQRIDPRQTLSVRLC